MENTAKQRYYLLFTEQDLFGTWCLVKAFGSLVSRRGRTIVQVCETKQQALASLFDVESKKRQRGYSYADFPLIDRFHLRPQTIKDVMTNIKAKSQKVIPAQNLAFPDINPDQPELF